MSRLIKWFVSIIFFFVIIHTPVFSEDLVTTPKEFLGANIGDDYYLANYTQLTEYWKKLDQESDRIKIVEIGTTAEGQTMVMAIVTSAENHKNLDRYKTIARRMALAEGLAPEEARALAAEGRAVVWVDGGLHASEVVGAQQIIEMVFQMANQNDTETKRILDNVILLVTCTNPDGMNLVSNWYMKEEDPLKRSSRGLPQLYQKYTGHDNNRDFYMSTQPETVAVNHVLYREWFPQIVYNHHQTGPAGTVLFAPPFRDPFFYAYDPLIPLGIELVGAAMHSRFAVESKPGATMRSGARYSTWWNGGLRTTPYFHNMIGILTEIIGNPTPMQIPFIPQRLLAKNDYAYPITPQEWHFRKSIDYSITANRAILDLASKLREDFLFNIYTMAKNAIDKGSRDNWTIVPNSITDIESIIQKENVTASSGRSRSYPVKYYDQMHAPEKRDPRGYILPADQADFLTATKFINTLIKNGIAIHRATQDFEVNGKKYPKDSYVVLSAQAFRPHLLSMFEPQNHPDDIPYPGAPPTPTYDVAGWTLAFQMGVKFDRILDGFDGPFEKISDIVSPSGGLVSGTNGAAGYLFSHQVNDSFIAINRLLKSGENIYWLKEQIQSNGKTYPVGTFYIPAKSSTSGKLESISQDIGLQFEGIKTKPKGSALTLRPIKIGLWDQYGGSSGSGWMRWILEQFEFPFELVFPPTLDAGNLNSQFDVLIFPGGAIPGFSANSRQSSSASLEGIPEEFRNRVGRVTADKTIPQILEFMKGGGTVLTIGSSTNLVFHAKLPIKNALLEKQPDGTERQLSSEKYFVPGSILQAKVNNSIPIAHGIPERVDLTFSRSPVFKILPDSDASRIHPVAWFDTPDPLRSGWAWGQHHLEGCISIVEGEVGKGKLFAFGPEIGFRGQPHGTFKFLFNGIYYGTAKETTIK
ncbi:M14 metallopeptidase family protein [Acidobacteriota bacterium]